MECLQRYVDECNLEIGQSKRYAYCPFCKDTMGSKGFVVTRTKDGWFFWCFRCHTSRHISKSGATLRQVRNIIKEQPVVKTTSSSIVALPVDFTTEIPVTGLLWLQRYGVTDAEIKEFNFGYSPKLDRLILPVYSGSGELVYWQGRRLGTDTSVPKYKNVKSNKGDVYFKIENKASDVTVVVEDILSAIACGRAGYSAVALLGSFVPASLESFINTKHSLMWLDADKRRECVKYAKRLRACGLDCVPVILPTKDPKEYSVEEIQNIVTRKEVST